MIEPIQRTRATPYQVRPTEQAPEAGDVVASAFRQENMIVNAWQMQRGRPELDPNFDITAAAKNSTMWQNHAEHMLGAQSQAEFDSIEARLMQQQRDRQVLAQAGVGGFAASMVAGVMSPAIFVPLVGPSLGVRGAAQAFALAAAAATADEIPLLMNQELRTATEAGIGIAAGTVLGGLLGTTAVYMRGAAMRRAAEDLQNPNPPARSAVVVDGTGNFVRLGDDMELMLPQGLALRPADIPRVTEIERGARRALDSATREDWRGLRLLADDEAADPVARDLARRALEGSSRTARIAEVEGVPEAVVRAYDEYKIALARREGEEITDQIEMDLLSSVMGEDTAGMSFDELLDIFARIERAQPKAAARASEAIKALRDEMIDPLLTKAPNEYAPRTEGGSVGAAKPGERTVSLLPQWNAETGRMDYVPLGDPNVAPDPGGLANDPTGLLTQIGRINPVIRVVQQPGMPIKITNARKAMLQLSDSGLQMEGAARGVPPAAGGTVEARMGMYNAYLGEAYRIQRDAYIDYLGKENTFVVRRQVDFLSTINRSPGQGKLSFMEFKEQIADSLNGRVAQRVSEADKAASQIRKALFTKINEQMLAATEGRGAKSLYKILDGDDLEGSYFTHVFSTDKIYEDREGFIDMVANHYQNSANAAASRRWQKLQKQAASDAELEEILAMDAESARMELDAVDEALRGMPKMDELAPEYAVIRSLRDERAALRDEEFERLLDEPVASLGRPLYKRGDAEDERAALSLAKKNVREAYVELTEEIDRLEAALPENAKAVLDESRRLRSRRSALQKSAGRMEEKQLEALEAIQRNEELNLRGIESFEKKARALQGKLDKIDDAQMDAELARLEAQFDRTLKQIEKSEAKLTKLRGQAGTEFEPTDKISIEQSRLEMRQQRAEGTLARFGKAAAYDRAGARQALEDRLTAARKYAARTIGERGERNARLKQKFEKNNPEQIAQKLEAARVRRAAREEEFDEWLRSGEINDFDPEAGTFDFMPVARRLASALSHKITGSPLRIGQLDAMPELRGPMKRRVLDIPYEEKRKFLELDTERVFSRYAQTMGADIELFRAFGDVRGQTMLENVELELTRVESFLRTRQTDEAGKPITDKQREKQIFAHTKHGREMLIDLQHNINRIRGLAGMPKDPLSFWYRAGRTMMHANVASMMGGAMITSIPDLARPIMAHGTLRTFRDGWVPFMGGLASEAQREINSATRRQLALLNIGIEMFTQQRAQSSFGLEMDTPGRTRFERGVEFLGRKMPQVALFGPWTDWNRTLAGMVTMTRLLDNIDQIAQGRMRPNDPELRYTIETGITPELAERIAAQYNSPSGHNMVRGSKVPNLESWDDLEALNAFGAALNRESDRIILQPGLERPRVADEHIAGRMFMQFRSFTMAAHNKMLISGLQQRDMAAFQFLQGTMFSLALGAISYYAWARATSDRATEEMQNASWQTWLDQAVYRSGVLGGFSEVQSIGSKIPAVADYATFAGGDLAGRRPSSLMGAVFGPSFGTSETIANVLIGMDQPTQGTLAQARKLVPYQNLFYLRRALNLVEEGLGETLGLPETRQ